MNNVELLKQKITDINNQCIRVQTLVDQAQKQCEAIENKYGVSSLDELKALLDKSQQDYEQQIQQAEQYIQETTQILNTYQGVL